MRRLACIHTRSVLLSSLTQDTLCFSFANFLPLTIFRNGTVENQIKITQFSAGVDISMAVSTEGDVYGWGKGKGGRIGLGLSDVDILLPRRIPLGEIKAIDVECGYLHSVIVGLNGSIFMCGGMLGKEENNNLGQNHEASEQNESSCNEGKIINSIFLSTFFTFFFIFLFFFLIFFFCI
jgi:hypothetical protein